MRAALRYRETETLATWLLEHPGVQVVSRNRAKAYKAGITQGAPEAIQVADRFHLLQNLVETLDQVFNTHGQDLKAVEAAHSFSSQTRTDGTTVVPRSATLLDGERAAENPTASDTAIIHLSTSLEITSPGLQSSSDRSSGWHWENERVSLSPHTQLS